jgi:uncharacterized protein (DUF736 family)
MNDYEQKDNSGAIFKNDKKETENHPDYKGSARVAGVDYWVSVWVNTSANGNKYMSTSYTPKEAANPVVAPQVTQAVAPAEMTIEDMDDDIPF